MSLIATLLVVLLTILPIDFCMSFVMFLIALVIPTFSAPFWTPPKNVCHPNPIMARIKTPTMIINSRKPNNKYNIIHKFLKYYVFCLQNNSRYQPSWRSYKVPSYIWWYGNCFWMPVVTMMYIKSKTVSTAKVDLITSNKSMICHLS